MKAWKRFLIALLAVLMLCSLVACDEEPPAEEPAPDEGSTPTNPDTVVEKAIDLYFITGQSNAAGYSKVNDAQALYEVAPGLENGYSNILYAGTALVGGSDGNPGVYKKEWTPTTIGCGRGANYIGPEAGMAAALSSYYNAESGKMAGIIKYAHGGTSLLAVSDGNNIYGNWAPPSYIESLNMEWDEESNHGRLYREFLDQVYKNVSELKEKGYNKFNIKGMYWMQGCNDRGTHAENPIIYPVAIDYFVKDVRKDLTIIMKQLTGSDCGAKDMPFVVGTLSETFSSAAESHVETYNKPFVAMQKTLPQTISKCYVLDNSQYAINRWDEDKGESVVVGTDSAHWSAIDALTIGKNLGELIKTEILK